MRELPPPALPGERAVGQLIAETIRAYGEHFGGRFRSAFRSPWRGR